MNAARTKSPLRAATRALAVVWLAFCSACAGASALRAELQSTPHERPVADVAPATELAPPARGRALFVVSCASCHGLDARGDEGPDLHDLRVSDRFIARVIRDGIQGEMPAFAKKHDANDIAALVAYLRWLD